MGKKPSAIWLFESEMEYPATTPLSLMPVAIVCPPRGGSKDVRVPSWLRTKPCWAASVSVKEPAIDPCPLMLSQGGFDSDPRSSGKTGFREVTIVPGGPNKVNMPCGERTNTPVVMIAA